MLNRGRVPILIYPKDKKLKSSEVNAVLSGTNRPLSRILNDVDVHPKVTKIINKLAFAFENQVVDYFANTKMDQLEKAWRQFDVDLDLHPEASRIGTVVALPNGHLAIELNSEFKNCLPLEKAWKPCENLAATICRLSFAAIFTSDGDYQPEFFKAMENSFPYEGGCLNRLQAVIATDKIGLWKFRNNLVQSAAIFMASGYLTALSIREDVSDAAHIFITKIINRISTHLLPEYVRLRFEKIDKDNQLRENIARPRVTNIIEECRKYEGHLLYTIRKSLEHKMQSFESDITSRQKLLKKKSGPVAKATLEQEIGHFTRKRNALVTAYASPKMADQLPVNMLESIPDLKDTLQKLQVLTKLKSTLSGNASFALKLKNFHKIFISEEMEPIRRAKDSESIQFLKIVGHLLLTVVTGGLYFAGAMIYSALTNHSPRFWLTPEEILLKNINKQLPKPEAPRIKLTKYAD